MITSVPTVSIIPKAIPTCARADVAIDGGDHQAAGGTEAAGKEVRQGKGRQRRRLPEQQDRHSNQQLAEDQCRPRRSPSEQQVQHDHPHGVEGTEHPRAVSDTPWVDCR